MSEEYSNLDKDELVALVNAETGSAFKAEEVTPALTERLDKALQALVDHPFNQAADGSVKALIGKYRFPLRKTIVSTVAIAASFTASGIALVGFPIAGVAGGIASVIAAAEQVSALVTKLDDVDLLVYHALLETAAERNKKRQAQRGSTLQEIKAIFDSRGEAPPPLLQEILDKLANKEILKVDLSGAEKRYTVIN